MTKGIGFLIEERYTMKLSKGELKTLLKAVQCLELYEGQGLDLTPAEVSQNELQLLRQFRSDLDKLARENISGVL